MAWQDDLVPASFRGVRFKVEDTAKIFGRRVDAQRIAGGDGSINRDQGEEPDEFDVRAFTVGPNYLGDRDDLEAALIKEGPGPLVLPTRGDLWARITGPVRSYERRARGHCEIAFHVVIEDKSAGGGLKRKPDTGANMRSSAGKLRGASAHDFADAYNAAKQPATGLAKIRAAMNATTDALRRANNAVASVMAVLDSPTAFIDDFNSQLNTLLSTPSNLFTKIRALVNAVLATAGVVRSNIDRLTGLANTGVPGAGTVANSRLTSTASASLTSSSSTAASTGKARASAYEAGAPARATARAAKRIAGLGAAAPSGGLASTASSAAARTTIASQADRSVRAIYRAVRAEALATCAENYADATFDSSTLALSIMEDITAECDALSAYDAGDELFQALVELRAACAEHLTVTAAQLPVVVIRTVFQETPAIVLAYQYHRDSDRDQELVARNNISDPLFIRGDLEIVTS